MLRRHLPFLATLAWPLRQALALDEAAATRLLFSQTDAGRHGDGMACSAARAWPGAEGLSVVVVPDTDTLLVALVGAGDGGAPQIVAGPVTVEPITIDPIWGCLLHVDDLAPLGGHPVIAVRIINSYTSTGRSSSTESLHLLLRDGAALRPIFGGMLAGSHREYSENGHNFINWRRRWRILRANARPGAMPDLIVRDTRNNAIVSRHRWGGESYVPPTFEQMPPFGPG